MKELYKKIWHYTIEDAYNFERQDRQFLALEKLEKTFKDKNSFLALVVANSIICYQLSWKGEDYWEEFSKYFSWKDINLENLLAELWKFISKSKNNKRLLNIKINRLAKLSEFITNFAWEKYFEDILLLRDDLNSALWQTKDTKTVVFAVKMFSYWARLVYWSHTCPFEISIPIDSRLKKLFEKYKEEYINEEEFYSDLVKKTWIPAIHLDAILWVNYEELIKDN